MTARVLVFVLLSGCMSAARGLDALREREVRLAGPNAVDCGVAQLGQTPETVNGCVVAAYESRRPFIARYYQQGYDSEVIESVVGNARGEVYSVHYDSNICGGGNHLPGCGERITDSRCGNARIVGERGSRRLQCRPGDM